MYIGYKHQYKKMLSMHSSVGCSSHPPMSLAGTYASNMYANFVKDTTGDSGGY